MSGLDRDGLRRIAEAATPGPWRPLTTGVRGGDHWYIVADGEALAWITANDGSNEEQREPDATHIAAFDPPTVLALLDTADAHDRLVAALREALAKWSGCWCDTQMAPDHDPRVQDCPQHGDDSCRHMAEGIVVDLRALLAEHGEAS